MLWAICPAILSRLGTLTSTVLIPPPILPPDAPIDEERRHNHDSKCLYPVKIGDVYAGVYEITAKLGFGGSSVVWLARDLRRFVL